MGCKHGGGLFETFETVFKFLEFETVHKRSLGQEWHHPHWRHTNCRNFPPLHFLPEAKYAAHTEQPRPHRPSRLLIPLESHDLPACKAHASYTLRRSWTSQGMQKHLRLRMEIFLELKVLMDLK